MRAHRWAWIVVSLGIWGVSHAGESGTNRPTDAASPAPTTRPHASPDRTAPKPSVSTGRRTEADDEMLNYLDVLEDLTVLDGLDTVESLQAIEDKEEDER